MSEEIELAQKNQKKIGSAEDNPDRVLQKTFAKKQLKWLTRVKIHKNQLRSESLNYTDCTAANSTLWRQVDKGSNQSYT
jgi:hypothetical protein